MQRSAICCQPTRDDGDGYVLVSGSVFLKQRSIIHPRKYRISCIVLFSVESAMSLHKKKMCPFTWSLNRKHTLLSSAGIVFTSHKLSKSHCAGNPVSARFDLCAGTAFKQDV